jgi:hypothetical protein
MRRPSDVGTQSALVCGTLMLMILPGTVSIPLARRDEEFSSKSVFKKLIFEWREQHGGAVLLLECRSVRGVFLPAPAPGVHEGA